MHPVESRLANLEGIEDLKHERVVEQVDRYWKLQNPQDHYKDTGKSWKLRSCQSTVHQCQCRCQG